MKRWIITAVIIGTVSIALTALAMPRGEGRGQGRSQGDGSRMGGGGLEGGRGIGLLMHHPEMAEEAGVTDEQIEQIRDLAYENRRAQIPLQSELSLAKLDMEHLISQDEPDTTAVNVAIENVGRIQTELTKLQVQQRIAIREILGTETIEKIQEIARETMRSRHKEQKGNQGDSQRRFSQGNRNRSGGFGRGCRPPELDDVSEN